MGVTFNKAEQHFDQAAAQLFAADPRVRSVGITRHGETPKG